MPKLMLHNSYALANFHPAMELMQIRRFNRNLQVNNNFHFRTLFYDRKHYNQQIRDKTEPKLPSLIIFELLNIKSRAKKPNKSPK